MGGRRGTSMARGSLHLEGKATVKLGSFPGRGSPDLSFGPSQDNRDVHAFKFGAVPESFQLYRGLTVPVDGGKTRYEYGAWIPSPGR
jgi:hypothetical protein